MKYFSTYLHTRRYCICLFNYLSAIEWHFCQVFQLFVIDIHLDTFVLTYIGDKAIPYSQPGSHVQTWILQGDVGSTLSSKPVSDLVGQRHNVKDHQL
jgi:hypothetical protein